jgi:hypothetical protein
VPARRARCPVRSQARVFASYSQIGLYRPPPGRMA